MISDHTTLETIPPLSEIFFDFIDSSINSLDCLYLIWKFWDCTGSEKDRDDWREKYECREELGVLKTLKYPTTVIGRSASLLHRPVPNNCHGAAHKLHGSSVDWACDLLIGSLYAFQRRREWHARTCDRGEITCVLSCLFGSARISAWTSRRGICLETCNSSGYALRHRRIATVREHSWGCLVKWIRFNSRQWRWAFEPASCTSE